ncbi:amidophosphoribosyltransferase [[Clostridium] bifermentans ATCC 638]|uniref:Amidophosphoribosyltransferase n=1 Tax=Paraclostridium bifermentans ATCC 638 = DSM 14991 TaxID=1233171 RepID=T4VR46_PARBF|nr:amidophosphoribosyltransferase [Paraclostridium bifermentans]EQK43147.1 amidophosphoribosyltransferase [[Clostridium] bifermentans ATCC 638] [Paraclostridium bifermentans ATCC 638 = DSM 14991]RIZ60374.1 amidophosphoribosyltransferase [Paraclostridium bifermentans]UAG17016.1 amidophosphoribosyltransferase [Paraclostridium bifermentans]
MQIDNMDKYKEECGVVGLFSTKKINLHSSLYSSLITLQHRGQDSCGVAFSDKESIECYKGVGLVNEVFSSDIPTNLNGYLGIGHVRYSTFGEINTLNAQPIFDNNSNCNIALSHNGNITNIFSLKNELKKFNFNTTSDSEVILKLIEKHFKNSIEEALCSVIKALEGGFSCVLLTKHELFAFRDPNGIRPLCIGKIKNSYIVCSESCVLDILGGKFIRDILPGEIIKIDNFGVTTINASNLCKCMTCSFEYIYFSRVDSIIDGVNVYNTRFKSGVNLYNEHPVDADIVIGVPESGNTAALGFSKASSIPITTGFVKNNFLGRSFIKPSQSKRCETVNLKLNVIKENVKSKKVVVVDDSIIRGTTCKKIVSILKDAGAKEIHYRVASPIVTSPCCLGINTSKSELIGSTMTLNEIANFIGADSLGYLSVSGFLNTLPKNKTTCLKCFL